MKKLIFLLFVGLFMFSCKTEKADQNKPKPPSDVDLIKGCYNHYQQGLLGGDGDKVMSLITDASVNYYKDILRYAKGADSLAIDQSALAEKFMILMTRQKIDDADLVKMTNKAFFRYVVKEGMIGRKSVEGVEMSDVIVNGNKASGTMIIDGKAQQHKFKFVKENGIWKLDLIDLTALATQGLSATIAESKLSENEHISQLLMVLTYKALKKNIWQPRT